jgi:hypothetical protein
VTSPPFQAPENGSEAQQNAALALYLLRLLEQRRDPHERIWPGERALRTVLYACHVAEALHDLGLPGLTHHLTEPALNWLIALPLDLLPEDLRPFRLVPARFKVLALAGKFDPSRLMGDLEALGQFFNPATGWLQEAPLDLAPTLLTLTWLDALGHLEARGLLPPAHKERLSAGLAAAEAALAGWLARALAEAEPGARAEEAAPRFGDLAPPAEAAYAVALLARFGRLPAEGDRADAARRALLEALPERQPGDWRRAERLHTALHLMQAFGSHAETRAAVEAVLAGMRRRYADDEAQREPVPVHALVLRLAIACHGEALRVALLESLWRDSRAHAEAEQRQEQAQLEAEFTALIRQTIKVQLTPPQRLTGTSARGEVYRLRFGLSTESTDEHSAPLSTPRDSLRLIVKKGPPDVLARAMRRYRELPDSLQRLFARHSTVPEGQAERAAPGYLIMQDLADMLPLSEVLGQLDRPVILAEEREQAAAAAAHAAGGVLRALHAHARRPGVLGHHLDVIYLTPMAAALEIVAQPQAFPELQAWLGGALTANRRRYRPPAWYLQQLRRHADRLTPPSLGYAHGDCHSRNLMLSRDNAECKFVDIETLTSAEDYLVDYGLLLEDVAVYQSLPYGAERGRLEWDEIETGQPGAPDNRITYPAFPRSEAVIAFQAELLRELGGFAAELGDAHWKPRLWLAAARGLLLLASRQLSSYAVEPHRRTRGPRYVNDGKLVRLAYAEALRLLRELVEHLNSRQPSALPDLPFSGAHRPARSGSLSPATALAAALDTALGADTDRQAVEGRPHLSDYVTRNGRRLVARLHAQRDAPVLYLAARPAKLLDAHQLAVPVSPGDPALAPGLLSRVDWRSAAEVEPTVELARQTRQLVNHAGGGA